MTLQNWDVVLWKVFQSTQDVNVGKLGPSWEVLYRIRSIAEKGTYELEIMEEKVLPSNWNVAHLKKYHFWENTYDQVSLVKLFIYSYNFTNTFR